jgi:hypothetical protein
MAALRSPSAAHSATLARLTQRYRCTEEGGRQGALVTGYEQLDQLLPRGGWPLGAIIELLSPASGIGELSLFLPVLARLAQTHRSIAWIAPPYVPYAPALAQRGLPLERVLIVHTRNPQESLWACEQALRCSAIGAVLSWPGHIIDRNLRRLQLAAECGGAIGILHRPIEARRESSPAALRLQLQSLDEHLRVHILKARGGRAGLTFQLRASDDLAVHSSARTGT